MAAGDLVTLPWQIELNGVLMGSGTSYIVRDFDPWSAPKIRAGEAPRAQQHGSFAGRDWLGERLVAAKIGINAGTSAADQTARRVLAAAWQPPEGTVVPLVWMEDDGVKYLVFGKPRLASSDLSSRVLTECRFVATDPRIYNAVASTATTTPPSGSGGLTFNATPNFTFGGAVTGGSMTVNNAGGFKTPWVATLTGPLTDPRIEHVEQSCTLFLTGSLAVGETLVIDSAARSILLGGTASRYTWLGPLSKWFDLTPGLQTVNLRAASGTGPILLAWRNANL